MKIFIMKQKNKKSDEYKLLLDEIKKYKEKGKEEEEKEKEK